MSKGLAGVKTLTAKQIADKWKLPLAVVAKKIAAGVKVEKEHTTSLKQANEIARDHLGERPDYYDKLDKMEKTKIIKEESATGAVRGLGYVTGDPGISAVDQYINTNSMAYYDENGNKLEMLKKQHYDHHNNSLGFKAFDPTRIGANRNFDTLKEAKLNELGEYEDKGGMPGYEPTSAPIRAVRKRDVAEQSPANPSYKERPMYEKSTGNNPVPAGVERGIYQEASTDKIQDYTTAAAMRLYSGTDADNRQKEVNRITGINTAVRKLHPDMYPGEIKIPATINEISANTVGAVSNARFWRGEPASRTLNRAIIKKFIESGKEKEQPKKEVKEDANRPDKDLEAKTYTGATGTTHTTHEETKMDNKELINEALDCILEDNLPEMKDNLMKALQEKAIEKLEERKKEIAANYFAQ